MAFDTSVQTSDMPLIRREEFLKFRDFFYRKTGIYYEEHKQSTIELRLFKHMTEMGFDDFRLYFNHLRFQASGLDLQSLINRMTVNETFFMREENQLQCLVNSALDEVMRIRRADNLLRLWSIPCSTGEEPYSLALYLLERWPKVDHVNIAISASDIDSNVLEQAKKGVYGPRSVNNIPKAWLQRYFRTIGPGQFQIAKELRDSIDFSLLNLSDPVQTKHFRGYDVIFCRNLLIYFDQESRRRAAETFYDALNPGGFLFLGHAESMSRISSLFKVRHFPDAIIYQKPGPT
ncbi:MAG: protein-glutamate O-methyltransferase CheR [Magnetococcus sp. YQC-5]